jgi:hypothetical protein
MDKICGTDVGEENRYIILVGGELKAREILEDLGLDDRLILGWIRRGGRGL